LRDLYIFVTSDRPDQYINSIVHCVQNGTNRVVFFQIEYSKNKQVSLNLLRTNVYDLIKNLSLGSYKYYIGNNANTIIPLDNEYNISELTKLKTFYSNILGDKIKWETEKIEYRDLRKRLSSLEKNMKEDIILDVTGVSKGYLVDIVVCCLLENIDRVYTFELVERPNYDEPWKMLIHELENGKRYKYTNLVETPIFEESSKEILIRTTPLRISIIGTTLFIALTLAATFILGNNSIVTQVISTIGTALGITSFFFIYFPIRGK